MEIDGKTKVNEAVSYSHFFQNHDTSISWLNVATGATAIKLEKLGELKTAVWSRLKRLWEEHL